MKKEKYNNRDKTTMSDQLLNKAEATQSHQQTGVESSIQVTEIIGNLKEQVTTLEEQLNLFYHVSDYELTLPIAKQLDDQFTPQYAKHSPSLLIREVIRQADIVENVLSSQKINSRIDSLKGNDSPEDINQRAKTVEALVGIILTAIGEQTYETIKTVRTYKALQPFYFVENAHDATINSLLSQIQTILQLESRTTLEEYYQILDRINSIRKMLSVLVEKTEDETQPQK